MLHNVGQGDIFGLEWLPLLLELVRQTDPPALVGYAITHFLGHIPAHELCGGFLAPLHVSSHVCLAACQPGGGIPVKMTQKYLISVKKKNNQAISALKMFLVTVFSHNREKTIGLSRLGRLNFGDAMG